MYLAESLAKKEGKTVAIYSSSTYVINCLIKWAPRWKNKDWERDGSPIPNQSLIKKIYGLHLQIQKNVKLYYLPSHKEIKANELADKMAAQALKTQEEELGVYPLSGIKQTVL